MGACFCSSGGFCSFGLVSPGLGVCSCLFGGLRLVVVAGASVGSGSCSSGELRLACGLAAFPIPRRTRQPNNGQATGEASRCPAFGDVGGWKAVRCCRQPGLLPESTSGGIWTGRESAEWQTWGGVGWLVRLGPGPGRVRGCLGGLLPSPVVGVRRVVGRLACRLFCLLGRLCW